MFNHILNLNFENREHHPNEMLLDEEYMFEEFEEEYDIDYKSTCNEGVFPKL